MNTRVEPLRAGLAILTTLGLVIAMMVVFSGAQAEASGEGSPAACDTGIQASGTQDSQSFTASSGQVVNGVCIKSGSNMFLPDNHSGVLGNGTYENGCYRVSGVGTQSVTVQRIGTPSDECQGLSHVDVIVGTASTTTSTTTTLPGETTTTTTNGDTTTTTAAGDTTTTTIADEVLGTVITTSTTVATTVADEVLGTEVLAEELPFTGVDSELLIGMGVLTLMSGLLALGLAGRREDA